MKNIILSFICVMALGSCKKEKVEGPQGAQGNPGNGISGNISGKITQVNQFNTNYSSGLNTTTVSIDGTSLSTITDIIGNYTLSSVPPGIYDISLNKNGCGLTKLQQVNFPGNGTLYLNGTISDKATHTFTNGAVTVNGQQINTLVNYPSSVNTKAGIVILGKMPNVDITNPTSYDAVQQFYIFPSTTTYSTNFSFAIFDSIAYPSGTTIFAKIYPTTNASSGYTDYSIGKFIYTGFGTPLPTTFTITRP
ncbi:MAG: hypothetical protein Q8T03_03545 [Bacteroidota bacterium]|nr:hypothetical protein [Bacteroidota bacterium]